MAAADLKKTRRRRRKLRVRKRIFGTLNRPRLTVFRSSKNIAVQLVDDVTGVTLCQAASLNKELREQITYGGNIAAAKAIGTVVAERAKEKGITQVAFDRNGYRYHGRIKALADAAREGGLGF
ncbi:MAG: 50S ribosomal protein L18 [Planctomycetes bacterium]|nr:50S ribosomal protein L18 [Planctomycetota bacterium]